MLEEAKRIRESFFIATTSGYVNSDHVVGIEAHREKPDQRTVLQVMKSGIEAYDSGPYSKVTVEASLSVVRELFAEHGYKFVTPEEIEHRQKKAEGLKP